jgi:peptidoglycan-associated lipoprotein
MIRALGCIAVCTGLLVTGCKSAEKKTDAIVGTETTTKVAGEGDEKKNIPADVKELLANFQRAYFDFNSHELNDETQKVLSTNAEIMQADPTLKVEIQGHADDRGTNEYNLALGQKRAKSVKDYMVRLGVAEDAITTISYGEEKPAVEASNESTWSKNRRAEFRVLWVKKTTKIVGTIE